MRHKHTDKDDFHTPGYIINAIKNIYGKIDFDMYCTDHNAIAEPMMYWNLADLRDAVIFANPPWSSSVIVQEVPKVYADLHESNTVIWLLPNKLCQVGWHYNVLPYMDDIIFLSGRVDFDGPYKATRGSSRYGSLLCEMSKKSQRHMMPEFHSWTLRALKEMNAC